MVFTESGTYHYWSGYVDAVKGLALLGKIVVGDHPNATSECLNYTTINGVEAIQNTSESKQVYAVQCIFSPLINTLDK